MTIAINANQHPHSVSNDFYLHCLLKIAEEHTDHQFILISSNTFGELENIPDNVLSAPSQKATHIALAFWAMSAVLSEAVQLICSGTLLGSNNTSILMVDCFMC